MLELEPSGASKQQDDSEPVTRCGSGHESNPTLLLHLLIRGTLQQQHPLAGSDGVSAVPAAQGGVGGRCL